MKEKPILFSAPMVRAILDGSKTQTRRIFKPKTIELLKFAGCLGEVSHFLDSNSLGKNDLAYVLEFCPYGEVGDQIWVRETFACGLCTESTMAYRATHKPSDLDEGHYEKIKWKPSIFMPRWASRIQLEINSVRVEVLNDISEADSAAEGWKKRKDLHQSHDAHKDAAKDWFMDLWESINGPGSWAENPWVWVIEFKKL